MNEYLNIDSDRYLFLSIMRTEMQIECSISEVSQGIKCKIPEQPSGPDAPVYMKLPFYFA